MSNGRLTKKGGFTENLDLTQEMGYSHIYNRLSVLEDKLENGELIELPFALGDEAWILDGEDIFSMLVDTIRCDDNGWVVGGYHHWGYHEFPVENAFHTRLEAEEQRKELIEKR